MLSFVCLPRFSERFWATIVSASSLAAVLIQENLKKTHGMFTLERKCEENKVTLFQNSTLINHRGLKVKRYFLLCFEFLTLTIFNGHSI